MSMNLSMGGSIYMSIEKYWSESGYEYITMELRSKHECKHQCKCVCKFMYEYVCEYVGYVTMYAKIFLNMYIMYIFIMWEWIY